MDKEYIENQRIDQGALENRRKIGLIKNASSFSLMSHSTENIQYKTSSVLHYHIYNHPV